MLTPSAAAPPDAPVQRKASGSPSAAVAGTPAVSPSAAVAGTPAVSPSAAVAGTPAGSPSAAVAGTPAGSPSAAVAGTPAGSPSAGVAASGGAAVQRDETIADQVPANVDLRSARITFTLPAHRKLAGSMLYDATTEAQTSVTIQASPRGLHIYTSPPLTFDVTFPGANMDFYSADVDFTTGGVSASFHKSGVGFDCTATGRETVVSLISRAIAGSPMAGAGYNPLTDPGLMSTLMRVKANFDSLPEARGSGGAGVGAADISRPTIGATLAMRTPFFQESDGAGVRIPAGGQFDVSIAGSGNLARILAAGNPQAAAMAAGINSVSVRSEAIELIKDGEAVAKLKSLRIAPGGAVTLQDFEMIGGLGTGAGIESLFRLLAGGVAMAERGVPLEVGMEATARSGGAEPEIVRGMSRTMIETGLSSAVRGLLRENRNAVPGIDLSLVFGV